MSYDPEMVELTNGAAELMRIHNGTRVVPAIRIGVPEANLVGESVDVQVYWDGSGLVVHLDTADAPDRPINLTVNVDHNDGVYRAVVLPE